MLAYSTLGTHLTFTLSDALPCLHLLPQVMLKAVNQLPPQLSWCGLAGMVLWADRQASPTASSSSECVWQSADALLDWAVRHRRCGTWASSLSSWAGGREPSSSSSSTGAVAMITACLPVLLRAVGPEGVSQEDAQQLQQCTGRCDLVASSSTSHCEPPTEQQQQQQNQSSKGRNGRQAKPARKQAEDDIAQAVDAVSNSEGALLLLYWCLCKLGGVLQQQLCSSKAPAAAGPGAAAAVVFQLLLEAVAAASQPGGCADFQVRTCHHRPASFQYAAVSAKQGNTPCQCGIKIA
jgi:hypothetical protein